jgi:hypothetical protein
MRVKRSVQAIGKTQLGGVNQGLAMVGYQLRMDEADAS